MKFSKYLTLMPHDSPKTPVEAASFLNSPVNTTTQGRRHQISLCSCSAPSFLFVPPLLSSVPWCLRGQKLVITKFSSWLQGVSPSDTGFPCVASAPVQRRAGWLYYSDFPRLQHFPTYYICPMCPSFTSPAVRNFHYLFQSTSKLKQFECWVL